MNNAVPIVSVLSGAAVAILVPLITAATQSGERRREHHRERVAALRETLVKSCFELAEVSTAVTNAAQRVGVERGIEVMLPDAPDQESSYRYFRERLLSTYRAGLILMLELGPDNEVVETFAEPLEDLNMLQATLLTARSSPETVERVEEELDSFFQGERRFHLVASALLIAREEDGERVFRRRLRHRPAATPS